MRRLAFALTLCASTLLMPRIADACSCVRSPGAIQSAAGAGAVFEAKALSKEEFEKSYGNGPQPHVQKMHRYTFEVIRVWKGGDIAPSASKVQVVTADNSAACGRTYEIGENYLVYAQHNAGEFSDGICSRTMKSADAADDFAALGEASGDWKAPEGTGEGSASDDGAGEGADGAGNEASPPVANPFERPDPPADGGQMVGPPAETSAPEPPPTEGSARGCSVTNADPMGGSRGAGALGLLFGLVWLRRRTRA